jgi:hypothetical protein
MPLHQQPSEINLEDRLPTFTEIEGFDAGAAWDRLTPSQQREIGILAVRFGTVGQCHGYFHETLEAVQTGFETAHWTPAAQTTAVWPADHIDVVERAADTAFNNLCNHFDPLWPQLFGWVAPRWSKPSIEQVAA